MILLQAILLIIESTTIVALYVRPFGTAGPPVRYTYTSQQSISIPYNRFNQPISSDTEYSLDPSYHGSWFITIRSQLVAPSNNQRGSEAQVALAPKYPSENQSIPTIIVQERGDGLLRIEYFAQDWENTYGLVLYNSTSPSWTGGQNITLKFVSFGPPSPINPELAPRPNGNLTITVGDTVVLSNYMIAWANLSSFYIYGLKGSSFTAGTVYITLYELKPS